MRRVLFFMIALLAVAYSQTPAPPNILANNMTAYTVTIVDPAAPPVIGQATVMQGQPGPATYVYWVVSNNAEGAVLSGPFTLTNAESTITPQFANSIFWMPQFNTSTYDLLRTPTEAPPTGACNCAVAIGSTLTSLSDTSNSTLAYTLPTLISPLVLTAKSGLNFGLIQSGSNSTATMVVLPGASLSYTGTGLIQSSNSDCLGGAFATTQNIACGFHAGLNVNTGGITAFGYQALDGATGNVNSVVAIGNGAASSLGSNSFNNSIAIGAGAASSALCTDCIVIGTSALEGSSTITSSANVAIGSNAMESSAGPILHNVAIGYHSMLGTSVNGAVGNVGIGFNALTPMNGGAENTAVGDNAGALGSSSISGSGNTFIGSGAGESGAGNISGNGNIALGQQSGQALTSGSGNVCIIGCKSVVPGSNNILIGSRTYAEVPSAGTSDYLDVDGFLTGPFGGATPGLQFSVPVSIGVAATSGNQTTTQTFTACNAAAAPGAAFCGQPLALTTSMTILDKGGCTGGQTDTIAGELTYWDAAGSHNITSSGFQTFIIGAGTNIGTWNVSYVVAANAGFHDVTVTITKTNGSCGGSAIYDILTNTANGVGSGQNFFAGPGGLTSPLAGTATMSVTSLPANSCGDNVTATVAGVTTSMEATASGQGALPSTGLIIQSAVTAANTVTVGYCNVTAAAIVPAALTAAIRVIQ